MKNILFITCLSLMALTEINAQCRTVASYQYDDFAELLMSYDVKVRSTYTYGELSKGSHSFLQRNFYAGNNYILGVVGDNRAGDIDIYVYDKFYNLLTKDVKTDQTAIIKFYAPYSGRYFIKVKMYSLRSGSSSCWTLVYGYY